MPKSPFIIVFDEQVYEQLDAIDRKYHSLIRRTIKTQLSFEPTTKTRNRKFLEEPTAIGATWELRFGIENRFRVFYAVDENAHRVVVLAIAVKLRNVLWIGKERFQL